MPSTPENGARIVFRSIVAWISPTWASVCFCSAAARSNSACEIDALAQQPLHPLEVETRQIALRFDRGQLRALLPRVELGQHVTPHGPLGRNRTRCDRRCRADPR